MMMLFWLTLLWTMSCNFFFGVQGFVGVVVGPHRVRVPVPLQQLQRHGHQCYHSRDGTFFSSSSSLSSTSLSSSTTSDNNNSNEPTADTTATLTFDSPVLTQVYPDLLIFREKHGHVNIPLGNTDGRKCETLRRLRVQGKLSERDVAALDTLEFRWHSLEDVYRTADFDQLFKRLKQYIAKENNNKNGEEGDLVEVSWPPKKYEPDPELGAWVTGIRRVGRTGVDPHHAAALDEIGFAWVSSRKCGSAFMNRYREILQLKQESSKTSSSYLQDVKVQQWIRAQQEAASRGTLGEARMHYMEQLLPGWKEWKP